MADSLGGTVVVPVPELSLLHPDKRNRERARIANQRLITFFISHKPPLSHFYGSAQGSLPLTEVSTYSASG